MSQLNLTKIRKYADRIDAEREKEAESSNITLPYISMWSSLLAL